jgi:hypothetical protein
VAAPRTSTPRVALCEPAHYSKLLLLPEMISDHLPDRVLLLLESAHRAALQVQEQTGEQTLSAGSHED